MPDSVAANLKCLNRPLAQVFRRPESLPGPTSGPHETIALDYYCNPTFSCTIAKKNILMVRICQICCYFSWVTMSRSRPQTRFRSCSWPPGPDVAEAS